MQANQFIRSPLTPSPDRTAQTAMVPTGVKQVVSRIYTEDTAKVTPETVFRRHYTLTTEAKAHHRIPLRAKAMEVRVATEKRAAGVTQVLVV